jgi:hypothetical protein
LAASRDDLRLHLHCVSLLLYGQQPSGISVRQLFICGKLPRLEETCCAAQDIAGLGK